MNTPARRALLVSGSLAIVWLLVVALGAVGSLAPSGGVRAVVAAAFPTGVTPFIWSWPLGWALLLPVASALAVALVHAALVRVTGGMDAGAARTWLCAVAAAAAVGMTVDAVLVFGSVFRYGWAMWSLDLGSRAGVGAYWGLLYGWIPALVAARTASWRRRKGTEEAPSGSRGSRGAAVGLVVAAVLSLVIVGGVHTAGDDAAQRIAREESDTAAPVPITDPVKERADGSGTSEPDGCTADRAMVLLGFADAATGHRAQQIRLMNFSDRPCVIEGYPDVDFADQNGNALPVTVVRDSSFMTSDPGPARIEVPAGGEAVAYLGWDAASTHGALVAATLYAAPLAGDARGSWPISSDIVEGSVVAVTAWRLAGPSDASEG